MRQPPAALLLLEHAQLIPLASACICLLQLGSGSIVAAFACSRHSQWCQSRNRTQLQLQRRMLRQQV